MFYRPYGQTGKQVSVIGFGGMRFGDIDNRDANVEMMLEAARVGINYFDTAPGYFGMKSEETFGAAFEEFQRRGIPFYSATKTFASDEKSIRTELENSLKRLKVDAIDFYHVWCITRLDNYEQRKRNGVIDTFFKLKEEGLIRHVCVSSHLIGDDIKELLMEDVFEGVLFGYSALTFPFRQEAFKAIAARDIGCVIMNPLGGGVIPEHPELFNFIKTQPDETAVEAAIRFLMAHERITCILIGFRRKEEIQEALDAIEGYQPISEATMEKMKLGIGESLKDLCTGCGYCRDCPEKIPVAELMDGYNFGKLSGQDKALLDRLRWHWNIPTSEAARCVECGKCEDDCTQHLPIIQRLKEIAAIKIEKPTT